MGRLIRLKGVSVDFTSNARVSRSALVIKVKLVEEQRRQREYFRVMCAFCFSAAAMLARTAYTGLVYNIYIIYNIIII